MTVESSAYRRLGVSAAKADVEAAAATLGRGLFPTSFCRVMPDVYTGDPEYCLVSHSDGAGTKAILAYLDYRASGQAHSFRAIAHDALVMNLDDVICCGAVTGFTYVSIINRNSKRIGSDVLREVVDGTSATISWLDAHGVKIVFCGGETADVGDVVRTVIVDGALSTRMPRSKVIKNQLQPGHVVVALASGGTPASYETAHNSGIGSNGLTLARHVLLSARKLEGLLEVSDDAQEAESLYTGPYSPTDLLPGTEFTVMQALMSPTRTYAPVVREILKEHLDQISGIFHNTGGGQFKSLKVAQDLMIVKEIPSTVPPLFREIQRCSAMPWLEMAKVFNMGWRLELYCHEAAANDIIDIAQAFKIPAQVIGHVEQGVPGRRGLKISLMDETTTVVE